MGEIVPLLVKHQTNTLRWEDSVFPSNTFFWWDNYHVAIEDRGDCVTSVCMVSRLCHFSLYGEQTMSLQSVWWAQGGEQTMSLQSVWWADDVTSVCIVSRLCHFSLYGEQIMSLQSVWWADNVTPELHFWANVTVLLIFIQTCKIVKG